MWYYVWRVGKITLNIIDFRTGITFISFINAEGWFLEYNEKSKPNDIRTCGNIWLLKRRRWKKT